MMIEKLRNAAFWVLFPFVMLALRLVAQRDRESRPVYDSPVTRP